MLGASSGATSSASRCRTRPASCVPPGPTRWLGSSPTTGRPARGVTGTWADVDAPGSRPPGRGAPPTTRRILVHVVEETAPRPGRVDVLREQIDGPTGLWAGVDDIDAGPVR
ncbi:DinB family protein [Cellulomonas iranensis]|uniref:mycothiol transferase n=1 Tax=Cellulomonas iranensis TaxID=76862 RepID=UPI001CF2D0C4|nr:DUF664 domain-containing protein [Cellulomonas iranensis]UCN16512.1 DinB family protein [Cellulomonas iranensis]